MVFRSSGLFQRPVKELGASVVNTGASDSKTNYAFIELGDGRILKSVEVGRSINSKLTLAFERGEPMELHVISSKNIKGLGIIALKTADGRLFAQDVPDIPFFVRFSVKALFIMGVFMLPLFGLGIFLMWPAWKAQKLFSEAKGLRAYVRGLPQVVLLD